MPIKIANRMLDRICGYSALSRMALLDILFGSKCLPDEESKPAEPKFKVGDIAYYICSPTLKYKCTVTKVMQNEHSGKWEYNVMFEWGKPGMWITESDLEPYTEPKNEDSATLRAESVRESRIASEETHLRNLSQSSPNCDKQFDTIIKDGFHNHNRLHIAVMLCAGMLANDSNCYPIDRALELADALMKAAGEGGGE